MFTVDVRMLQIKSRASGIWEFRVSGGVGSFHNHVFAKQTKAFLQGGGGTWKIHQHTVFFS